MILSRYSPSSWVHLITVRALVILSTSGPSPFFRSLSTFHWASMFLITVFHEMLAVVMPRPVVSQYRTMSHAARSHLWDFYPKTKGGVEIVSPGDVLGVDSRIRPPGRRRPSVTCCMVFLSKYTKSSMVVIPSFPNCTTVLSGIPICAAFWDKSVVGAFVQTIFNYSLFLPCRWQSVLIIPPVPSLWWVGFESLLPMSWNQSTCSDDVLGYSSWSDGVVG